MSLIVYSIFNIIAFALATSVAIFRLVKNQLFGFEHMLYGIVAGASTFLTTIHILFVADSITHQTFLVLRSFGQPFLVITFIVLMLFYRTLPRYGKGN